jgi:molybdopterin/thiamine biosynthesis adenylyltransferase
MFVTIYEEALECIHAQVKELGQGASGYLDGRVIDDGGVIQITRVSEDARDSVGLWGCGIQEGEPTSFFFERTQPGDAVVLVGEDASSIWVGVRTANGWVPAPYDIVRLHADFASRLDGLFDTAYLADKTVTIVGLGTGGSLAAVELAKNGVGRFRLVDFDRLETHNIARHACGLTDIGRYKTRALADLLRDKHPSVQVETYELDVLQDLEQLVQIVEGSDLVIAATDSEASKRRLNEVCWPRSIPVVYGAAYDRAFGGDVLRVFPPDTPCYECFYKQITDIFDTVPKKTIDYSSEDPTQVVAEPGLGLDVAFIGLILTKMALLTLLQGTESTLEDFPKNYVMWGNRRWWIFEHPLQSLFMDVAINPTCLVCHPEAYAEQELQMTLEEARTLGERVVEEIEEMEAVSIEIWKEQTS